MDFEFHDDAGGSREQVENLTLHFLLLDLVESGSFLSLYFLKWLGKMPACPIFRSVLNFVDFYRYFPLKNGP